MRSNTILLASSVAIAAGIVAWIAVQRPGETPAIDEPSDATRVEQTPARLESSDSATIAESIEAPPAEAPREALRPPGDVRVRVVDTSGRPLGGIPVVLATERAREERGGIVRTTVAEDGIARFLGCEAELAREPRSARWSIALGIPDPRPRVVDVDPWQPPARDIELVAPDTGRLEVELQDADGRSVPVTGLVQLFVGSSEFTNGRSLRSQCAPYPYRAEASDRLVIEPIAIGARVRLDAWVDDHGAASVTGLGPSRAGEKARIDLRLGRHGPVLAGRYWNDWDYVPVVNGFVVSLAREGRQWDVSRHFRTSSDATGNLRIDLSKHDWEFLHPPQTIFLEDVESIMPTGIAAIPMPTSPGVSGGGFWTSSSMKQRVFAASVFDGGGTPLARALVVASPMSGEFTQPKPGDPLWDLRTGSGDNGQCEVYGITNGEPMFLQAFDGDSRASSPVRFLPGALDVRLFVRELGSLRGSIAVEPGVELAELAAFLRDSDRRAADTLGFFGRAPIASDGSFGWTRIPAGRYDVAIGFGLSGEALEVAKLLTDVEVRASAENRDARLDSMRLERTPRSLGIRIVDERGAPVPRGTVSVLARDGHALCTFEWRDGEVRVPGLDPALDVELRAPGRSTQRSNGVTDGAQLVLRPARGVRLSLEPSLEVVEGVRAPGLELVVTRTSARGDVIDEPRRVTLDASGAGELALEDSGTYRVVAALAGPSEGTATRRVQLRRDATERYTEWFGRQEFTVPDAAPSGDLQRIALTLPLAARWAWEDLLRASR